MIISFNRIKDINKMSTPKVPVTGPRRSVLNLGTSSSTVSTTPLSSPINIAPKSPSSINTVSPKSISPKGMSPIGTSQIKYPTISLEQTGAPKSPSARSAVLNLKNNRTPVSISNIPDSDIKIITSDLFSSSQPEISSDFQIRDYHGIIEGNSIENELIQLGYAPISRIIVNNAEQEHTKYIKCINKLGQRVYVMIDQHGFTTARGSDLYLHESMDVSIIPYSIKAGSYACAENEVCGVAFECGNNGICTMIREPQSLEPVESNYIFKTETKTGIITDSDSNISFPVVRLSEIKADKNLVLENTNIVTRKLRNTEYMAMLNELKLAQESFAELQKSFSEYNDMRETAGSMINRTLTQLEGWNEEYLRQPPTTDEGRETFKRIQHNLSYRNNCITTLLLSMRKIAELRFKVLEISSTIEEITSMCNKEFAHLAMALPTTDM